MTKEIIYLDYNATVPIRPEVIDTMVEVMKEGGNPSSIHGVGRRAKMSMEDARTNIANIINCRAQMITFTSGGTEANNMALLCGLRSRLIISNAAHDSIINCSDRFLGRVDMLSVDKDGLIDLSALEKLLKEDGKDTIVSILYANNETGVIQDVKKIAEIVHTAGALLHIDAIQALAKIPVDFMNMGCDLMSISSHKTGGPQGVGALVAYETLPVLSAILGGGQEVGRRGGTENIAGIAGFGRAVSMVPNSLLKMKILKEWRDEIEQKLSAHTPNVIFIGKDALRLPNVSMIAMKDVSSDVQVMNFDLENICVSAGSACSSGKVKSSHVIDAMSDAMSDDSNIASSSIRMSLGWDSKKEHVDAFIKCWTNQYDRKHLT